MTIFGGYARYYDLIYRDKDYNGEVAFVADLLRRHAPAAHNIVDLGCGTGRHAALLAERGFDVLGIDRSFDMLETARKRMAELPDKVRERLRFSQGDATDEVSSLELSDVVLSLFHVCSYQVRNEDLLSLFANAADRLREGGIFLFDYWYGPAVLTERPSVRVKRLRSDEIEVTRLAEPTLDAAAATVAVDYQVFVRDLQTQAVEELRERHVMRYLFTPEIALLADVAGFEPIADIEWMTGAKPGFSTWSVCSVLRKRPAR